MDNLEPTAQTQIIAVSEYTHLSHGKDSCPVTPVAAQLKKQYTTNQGRFENAWGAPKYL